MKVTLSLVAAASIAFPTLAAPSFASAQEYRSYGSYDPCRAEQQAAAKNGTLAGGVLGAVVGSAVAGRGSRLGGAIVGGTVGAVAGHQIAKHSIRCVAYPGGFRHHGLNCRWVEEYYSRRNHGFEVCRDSDGVWRPSGRH